MPVVTRRELLEAGVHFGHQTRRWNPKMHRYLYGERSGIYIIDLEKSLSGLEETYDFVQGLGRRRGIVLFVGTKKQAQEVVQEQADRIGMPYVNHRWLGGMLTNFTTVSKRLLRLRELREMDRTGALDYLPKKEAIRLRHERDKLQRNLGGIQDLERLPDAVFVIDTKKEHIAVNEARKLGIPVIAIVDTNCDPDEVDYVIPGNDDAIRAVNLVTRVVADALANGYGMAKDEDDRACHRPDPRRRRARNPRPHPPGWRSTRSRRPKMPRAIAISTVFEPDAAPSARRSPEAAAPEAAPEAEAATAVESEPTEAGAAEPVEPTEPDAPTEPTQPPKPDRGVTHPMSDDISAADVKKLRDLTGAGMMDCKNALVETGGDFDKAVERLREKGLASAAKRAGRSANQGLVEALHPLQQHRGRARRGQL